MIIWVHQRGLDVIPGRGGQVGDRTDDGPSPIASSTWVISSSVARRECPGGTPFQAHPGDLIASSAPTCTSAAVLGSRSRDTGKPSLSPAWSSTNLSSMTQTTLIAVQRLVGALIGAAAAVLVLLLLLIPASEHGLRLFAISRGLEVVARVLFVHAAAIRLWNYAAYSAAIAARVLILVELPQASNYGEEWDRVL